MAELLVQSTGTMVPGSPSAPAPEIPVYDIETSVPPSPLALAVLVTCHLVSRAEEM